MNFNISALLDWLFPRPIALADIERLTATKLRRRVRPPPKMRLPALRDVPVAATAIFDYRQPLIRQAVWELKYRGNSTIARLFAEVAAEELGKIILQTPKEVVLIPLPNSAARRRERGWNQIELVARHIPGHLPKINIRADVLRKIRHTAPQATLKSRQRLTNLADCFRLDKNFRAKLPADPLIVLLDDVTTTGATFAEALKPFFAAGFSDVYCLAIAH